MFSTSGSASGCSGSTIVTCRPTRCTWASRRVVPSMNVMSYSGSGSAYPSIMTVSCFCGRKLGGKSNRLDWALKEDITSQSTGPNITTTPASR